MTSHIQNRLWNDETRFSLHIETVVVAVAMVVTGVKGKKQVHETASVLPASVETTHSTRALVPHVDAILRPSLVGILEASLLELWVSRVSGFAGSRNSLHALLRLFASAINP